MAGDILALTNTVTVGGKPLATTRQLDYDAAGNVTSFPDVESLSPTFHCKYDAWNRLVFMSGGDVQTQLEYDDLGRRIVKRDVSSYPGEHRHYYYDSAGRILSEWLEVHEKPGPLPKPLLSTPMIRLEREYVWGPRGPRDLILRQRRQIVIEGAAEVVQQERFYALQDAQFNVTALVKFSLDERERPVPAVVEELFYEPHGNVQIRATVDGLPKLLSTSPRDWNLFSGGNLFDGSLGLYDLSGVCYHPALGRELANGQLRVTPESQLNAQVTTPESLASSPSTRIASTSRSVSTEESSKDWLDQAASLFAGFADVVSFGGVTWLNEQLWGDIARNNHQGTAYNIGQGLGIAHSLTLGFGAARAAQLGQAGWGLRAAQTHLLAGDAVAVAQSSYNLYHGQFSAGDAVGFLPTVGWSIRGLGRVRSALGRGLIAGKIGSLPRGRESLALRELYLDQVNSKMFKAKLAIHNSIKKATTFGRSKWVAHNDIRDILANSASFRIGLPTVHKTTHGFMIGGIEGTHYLNRTFAHHEMLHIGQYLRNPNIIDTRPFGYIHEIIPSYVGTPEIYVTGTIVVAGGSYLVGNWLTGYK